jgi:hypothetical protein
LHDVITKFDHILGLIHKNKTRQRYKPTFLTSNKKYYSFYTEINFGNLQAQCGRDNVYNNNKNVRDMNKDSATRNATIQCPNFPITASFFLSVCTDMITALNKEKVWTTTDGKYTTDTENVETIRQDDWL